MNSAGANEGAVVVTGASRGVGRYTAEQLAQRGYCVYAGVLSTQEAQAWDSEAARAPRLIAIPLNITRESDIAALVERLNADGVRLRAVVNVAGISQFDAIEHVDLAVARRIFDVNVFGTLALTQALLPKIKASKGRLIFVTSMAAQVSAPLLGVYSASKAAMESLIDSLRVELRAWSVEVAIVEPGGIRTTMVDEALAHLRKAIVRSQTNGPDSQPYIAAYKSIAEGVEKGLAKYLPPEAVAETLAEMVEAGSVPIRSLLGLDAKALVLLRRLLPDRWLDAALAKQFRL